MSQAPAMPVFTDALIGDTTHLSAEQFGAYCLILFATWRNNGKALPDDDIRLARVCRVSMRVWRARIRPALIDFFDLSDHTLRQKRLEKEWNSVQKYLQKQRRLAISGGKARALKNNNTAVPCGTIWAVPRSCPEAATQSQSQSQEDSESVSDSETTKAKPENPPQEFKNNIQVSVRASARLGNPEPDRQKSSDWLSNRKRDQLLQKIIRFAMATIPKSELAIEGLLSDDKAEAQRWFDLLDMQMRSTGWQEHVNAVGDGIIRGPPRPEAADG